jgi:histidinol-phosphate/aromatic aminotransferase/cobyric acid decarboxylase-like protein
MGDLTAAIVTVIPPPGAHGGDGPRIAAALGRDASDIFDLSLSLNPFAPDVTKLVARHATATRRYPDPEVARHALADAIGVSAERLVVTNGGAEAIALVAAQLPEGEVVAPEFSLYEKHLSSIRRGAPRWRSNPNNPTGRLAGTDDQAAVWDEAFYPLATGCWTRADPDAIVVGSLTKVFACPGLRLGYVIAPDPDAARDLMARQPEWSVNAVACAVLPELLPHAALPQWADRIAGQRQELATVLRRVGLSPDPSDANYVLVRHAPGLRDHLARRGVVVRDTASFGLAGGVRVAVPDDDGLARLEHALTGWEP